MPLENDAQFTNPQPPANYRPQATKDDSSLHPLTNADFRKLLMTPAGSGVHRIDATVRSTNKASLGGSSVTSSKSSASSKSLKSNNDSAEKRKLKKLYYASLMNEIKEREDELAKKYRDRAKERRDAGSTKTSSLADTDSFSTTNMYGAVGPVLNDQLESRRRMIEESKYLGGDLEHTHLVKGLDYALLQKVRAELDQREAFEAQKDQLQSQTTNKLGDEQEEVDDEEQNQTLKKLQMKLDALKTELKEEKQKEEAVDAASKLTFKTKLAKNISRVVFRPPPPKSNDLFLPRRMAYVMDLDDEETDIPVTLMRSKAECPTQEVASSTSTNDIVINKLTQILSYLRQDGKKDLKNKKKIVKEKHEDVPLVQNNSDLGIYDNIDDYKPEVIAKKDSFSRPEFMMPCVPKRSYFSNTNLDEKRDASGSGPSKESATAFIRNINEKYSSSQNNSKIMPKENDKKSITSGMNVKFDSDSYSECYPGTIAEDDVYFDSDEDDETADENLKKAASNKYNFGTSEDGSQSNSSVYRIKAKLIDPKHDKQKIDKEWGQISKLIDKRKAGEYSASDLKKIKY